MPTDSETSRRTIIGPRAAVALYALLIAFACWRLHGKALALALIIVLGTAVKSFLHYWRERDEGESVREGDR